MAENNTIDYSKIYKQSTDNNNTNLESKNIDYNFKHCFCPGCHKFPFIKFCKDRKNIRLTCSCFNNKKILIEELFKINSNKDNLSIFLSDNNSNINIENEFLCKEHKKKFKGFSKFLLNNYCEDCIIYNTHEISEKDIIRFDDIKIEDKKIDELIEKINNNNDICEEISREASNNIGLNKKNNNNDKKLLEEEEKRFKKLTNIIINDYKKYPNFSHFFNIKNLLYFFKIEDKPIDKEENIDDNFVDKNEPIILNLLIIFQIKLNYLVRYLSKIIKQNLRLKLREKYLI